VNQAAAIKHVSRKVQKLPKPSVSAETAEMKVETEMRKDNEKENDF